ncbi:MAG: ribonucleoside-diphosphate reductase, adenosylcobalamin-dependent, partial [Nanoarchaeota archaeon]|nr:ribonucleoside-diphosphate reductase, adenosylcobalamin-dependent [Nanoarchaeota archaeon]
MVIKKVVKRNGRIVKFDPNRIRNAIKRAMLAVGRYDEKKLDHVVKHVLKLLEKKFVRKMPHVEEIQDVVEISLIHYDLYEVAKAYILYRKERERIREEKKRILGKDSLDEVDKSLPLESIRVLAKRYLLKDEKGKFIEGPKQLFQRVAMLVVIPDILYDPLVFDKEGKQKVHKREKFSPEEWEGKLGFKKVKWNRFHLERMKSLYDELNKQGKMKVPWKVFLGLLKGGKFERYYK